MHKGKKLWHNAVEPEELVRHFLAFPPERFIVGVASEMMLWFEADLDLTTSMDVQLRRQLRSHPLFRYFGAWLTWRTMFVGCTVSEYCPLPQDMQADEFVSQMFIGEFNTRRRANKLLVVKDIPFDSPLLSEEDRNFAVEFLAALRRRGFVVLEGQALAWVPIDFKDADDYLSRLSGKRRKDIRRKLKNRDILDVQCIRTGDDWLKDPNVRRTLYGLYEQVYAQSDIHFDRLTIEFFDAILQDANCGGRLFVYRERDHIVGWNLCFHHGRTLVDKYIGLDYPRARELSIFVVNWMRNLEYARLTGMEQFVAGWTDPQIKSDLGARFTFTRHAIFPQNAALRAVLRRVAPLFEGDRKWYEKRQLKQYDK